MRQTVTELTVAYVTHDT